MDKPRLTIGIPTLDRPEFLQHALDSCLAQTVPVRILVADQGQSDGTAAVMDRYGRHPNVYHYKTNWVECLWDNWKAAAEWANENDEFFAWLQDDDLISRVYASRVIKAFDAFPDALHWQANCHCTVDRVHAVKWGWNGPQVPVLMRDSGAEMFPGSVLLASMYLVSWALSPGVAFRCGVEFEAALDGMPRHCDLFAERLILAAMGAQGHWVADSVTAGYWFHHADNESYKQNSGNTVVAQRKVMIAGLDEMLDNVPSWDDSFAMWLQIRNPSEILGWLKGFECNESRHAERIKETMRHSLKGRIATDDPEAMDEFLKKFHEPPMPAREHAHTNCDPVLACG